MGNLRNIGAFWAKKSQTGKTFLAGKVNDIDVLVFKNEKKEKENQPDYNVAVDVEKFPQFAEEAPAQAQENNNEIVVEDIDF